MFGKSRMLPMCSCDGKETLVPPTFVAILQRQITQICASMSASMEKRGASKTEPEEANYSRPSLSRLRYLEQPLISKRISDPCFNIEI